ncbi:MAG: hypothetical protein ACRAVC_15110 [Trichormus sp.]
MSKYPLLNNAQCPMPNAQCPIPHAQCPMPNSPCPMPHAQCPMPNSPFINLSVLDANFKHQLQNYQDWHS